MLFVENLRAYTIIYLYNLTCICSITYGYTLLNIIFYKLDNVYTIYIVIQCIFKLKLFDPVLILINIIL